MSFFLHPTNQELLWKTIHKLPLFPTFSATFSETTIPLWFKEQIRILYERQNLISITKEQLPQVNRFSIQYMNEKMKEYVNTTTPPPLAPPSTVLPLEPNKELSREWIAGQKQDSLNAVFQERQKSYETLMKKPEPATVTFTEAEPDGPIPNMEELIKQHMAERNLLTVEPPTITITEEKPLHNIQITSLEPSKEKRVRFADSGDSLATILEALSKLNEKIDGFSKELGALKQHIFGQDSSFESTVKDSSFESTAKDSSLGDSLESSLE
jgi:hypothetical protein